MKRKFNRQTQLFSERPKFKSIGYARESSNTQVSIGNQIEELKNEGCCIVFQETINTNKKRPQFEEALGTLEKGDEIVFTKLDRGFKNQRQCINTLYDLQKKRDARSHN